MKIPCSYYQSDDVVALAKNLLGKFLFTNINHQLCGGIITETEAYAGIEDRASHAYGNRQTNRTKVMYENGGRSYVYFSYGMHHLFNIVSSRKGNPHAILIRAIFPTHGIDLLAIRRKKKPADKNLCNGPAKLCQALGITLKQNNILLDGDTVWLEDRGLIIQQHDIVSSPRIGVNYAQEDALLPYRFFIKNQQQFLKFRP